MRTGFAQVSRKNVRHRLDLNSKSRRRYEDCRWCKHAMYSVCSKLMFLQCSVIITASETSASTPSYNINKNPQVNTIMLQRQWSAKLSGLENAEALSSFNYDLNLTIYIFNTSVPHEHLQHFLIFFLKCREYIQQSAWILMNDEWSSVTLWNITINSYLLVWFWQIPFNFSIDYF